VTFPLVYANGCSYSTPGDGLRVHADYVTEQINAFHINNSIRGSCNRRIIRTSIYDIIEQRKINPSQKIIALISLSFELRSELWLEDNKPINAQESNFVTHSFSATTDWRTRLFKGTLLNDSIGNSKIPNSKFLEQYNNGRAYFYSPYAERINLLTDLLMFTAICEKYNINYLLFQAPKAEKLENEHLLDFLKNQLYNDPRVFDLETFGFLDWAYNQKFNPLDMLDTPQIAHYNSDAHQAFANEILMPKLAETGQL
jgi:hypothetical protein